MKTSLPTSAHHCEVPVPVSHIRSGACVSLCDRLRFLGDIGDDPGEVITERNGAVGSRAQPDGTVAAMRCAPRSPERLDASTAASIVRSAISSEFSTGRDAIETSSSLCGTSELRVGMSGEPRPRPSECSLCFETAASSAAARLLEIRLHQEKGPSAVVCLLLASGSLPHTFTQLRER